MEEFVDFTEKVEEESLTLEEKAELERQFQEEHFIPEGELPHDWRLF